MPKLMTLRVLCSFHQQNIGATLLWGIECPPMRQTLRDPHPQRRKREPPKKESHQEKERHQVQRKRGRGRGRGSASAASASEAPRTEGAEGARTQGRGRGGRLAALLGIVWLWQWTCNISLLATAFVGLVCWWWIVGCVCWMMDVYVGWWLLRFCYTYLWCDIIYILGPYIFACYVQLYVTSCTMMLPFF